jgi:hypothetical protein
MIERARNGGLELINIPFGKMGGTNTVFLKSNTMQDIRGNNFEVQRMEDYQPRPRY